MILENGIPLLLNNMQSNLVLNRLNNILTGALLGFATALLIHVVLFEHATFFILLPVLPLLGIISGVILRMKIKIPPFKTWISLFIFTVIISISVSISTIRGNILEEQRRKISRSIALMHPEVHILNTKYSVGNGMEVPPHVTLRISNDNSFESVSEFYNNILQSNKWNVRASGRQWKKENYVIYLNNYYREQDKKLELEDYRITVDFYGSWMTHFKDPLIK